MSLLARTLSSLFSHRSRRAAKRRTTCLRAERLESRNLLAAIHTDENWANADGGAKDLNSGLVWSTDFSKIFGGSQNYSTAVSRAANLVAGGYDDWRLPTLTELDTAAKHGVFNHVDSSVIPAPYWTSTQATFKTVHWAVSPAWEQRNLNDASSVPAIAVRGTASPVTHSTPKVRVYSQDLDTKEDIGYRFFSAVLDTAPTADVSFSISSNGNPAEGTVDISSMLFTPSNWNLPQRGMVRSLDDSYLDPNTTYTLTLSNAVSADPAYNGLDVADIRVVDKDNDMAIAFGPYAAITSESGTNWIDVSLGAIPRNGPVHITLATDRPGEASVPSTQLVFDATNWNVLQRVTVTGVADGVADGDQFYRILASVAAGSSTEFLGATATSGVVHTNVDIDGTLVTFTSSGVNSNLKIPSPGTALSRIVVADNRLVGDLNVTLNINHPINSELSITLIGPDGTRVPLISGAGGSNFTNTTFDDEAAIYAGTLRPREWWGLSVFDQKPVNGTWTLEVTDNTRKNVGTILNWSLKASLIPAPLLAASAPLDAASLDFLFGDGGRKR